MKKIVVVILVAFSLFIPQAQAESWRKLNVTCGSENTTFNDVAIASSSTVYVVGSTPAGGASVAGIICKSTDRGDSWVTLDIPAAATTTYINAIDCRDESHCFAVTSACQILKTTTGGEGAGAWSLTTRLDTRPFFVGPDPCNSFNDVEIVPGTDGNTVVAVGNLGTIARTTNGGASWSVLNFPDIPASFQTPLQSIHFAGGNGWIAGDNITALKSINGGASWAIASTPTLNGGLKNVFGLGSHVWLNGTIDISRSDDSGESWNPAEVISSVFTADDGTSMGNLSFVDSHFVSSTSGWTVGAGIRKTIDGGASWLEGVEDTTVLDTEGNVVSIIPSQKAIEFRFANEGFIVGWERLVLRRYTPPAQVVFGDQDNTITIYPNLVPYRLPWSANCSNQQREIYHIITGVENIGQAGVAASQLPFSVRLEAVDEDGNPIGTPGIYPINTFPAGTLIMMIDLTEGGTVSSYDLYQRFNPRCVSNPRIRMTVDVDNIVREAEDPSGAWENDNVVGRTIDCGPAVVVCPSDAPQPSPPPRAEEEEQQQSSPPLRLGDKAKKKKIEQKKKVEEKKKKSKWGK